MSGYYIKLGHTLRICFGTSDSTGAASDADSTPVVTILEQGSSLVYSPTVTNKAVGLYEVVVDCTVGNGFEDGKEYSAYVAATVDTIVGRDGIGSFKIQTMDVNVVSIASAAAQAIRDEILVYSHRSGRTVRGLLRRLESFVAGKASGLNASSATFYAPDGNTVEMTAMQDTSAGTRNAASVTGSETP